MSISKEIMLEMYKRMDQVRKFEEKVSEFFAKGMIHGTTHLSIGQEASGVPAVMALEDGDLVTLTHRGHAMSIGMGIDLNKMMAELMGKATGFCKGKGGSMHIVDVDAGNLGSNGVVGGGLTLAPGAALTQKYKKTGKIVLCSFGDGASNEGSFHEGVNLSSVWKLPVIFYCENNLYGMSTHHTKVMNVKNVADRASSYGIQSFIVDGYDAVAVYEGTRKAENDAQVMERYEQAVEACRVWLRAVVGTQVIANQSDDICVEAELIMPDRLVEVAVYSAQYPFGGGCNADVVEKLHTPIGNFGYQVYRAILDTPINPVKELYKFFQDLIHQIHNIIVMPIHCDGMDDLLNKYIVEDEGIVDVLGVSRYDALWSNVMDFMADDYSEGAV